MKKYSQWLIRIAVLCSIVGAMLGSDMAGRKDYSLIPVHSHILVVGWLTLFVYGVFYYVFKELHMLKIAKIQAVLAMLGGPLLPLGMLFYYKFDHPLALLGFIIAGTILLISLILFGIIVFFDKKVFAED